ncbi:MAG TPA: class I SAM-dependent methyltransferase [Anaerolineae bacterium]|nr:class I SAM-dependent methyltransferase [Anaerolineae bacterium]
MPIRLDPEDTETQALLDFAGDFAGKRVLEIGCGDGRLTWRYAKRAARIVAIDPDAEEIKIAEEDRPPDVRVEFRAISLEAYQAPDAIFDVAILSWSL